MSMPSVRMRLVRVLSVLPNHYKRLLQRPATGQDEVGDEKQHRAGRRDRHGKTRLRGRSLDVERSVLHRGRHGAHRGRLWGGCGKYPEPPAAGRRL